MIGYGEATAVPDVLRVVLGVGCRDADVAAAMRAAARRTDAVTAALRDVGLEVSDRDPALHRAREAAFGMRAPGRGSTPYSRAVGSVRCGR